jgi:hypothetical protein
VVINGDTKRKMRVAMLISSTIRPPDVASGTGYRSSADSS